MEIIQHKKQYFQFPINKKAKKSYNLNKNIFLIVSKFVLIAKLSATNFITYPLKVYYLVCLTTKLLINNYNAYKGLILPFNENSHCKEII